MPSSCNVQSEGLPHPIRVRGHLLNGLHRRHCPSKVAGVKEESVSPMFASHAGHGDARAFKCWCYERQGEELESFLSLDVWR